MLGQIPPWLAVNPRDFTEASEQGIRLGLDATGQQNQVSEDAAHLSQSAQEAQLNRQQQAAESGAQQQLEQERLAASQAEAKQRLALETQAAARKFQVQQGYAQAVASGVDPVQAMMQFGPQMGESMAGLGPLALDQFRAKQAALPPVQFMGPDGKPAGVTYGGTAHMFPKTQAQLPDKMSEQDKLAANHYMAELAAVNKGESENASDPDSGTARSLRARRDKAEAALKNLGIPIDGEGGEEDSGEAPAGDGSGKGSGLKILSIEQVPATAGAASQ